MATKLTEHFTLEEMTYSATAAANKIDNTPPAEHRKHLQELCDYILEPLRVAWGAPIKVTSGYRGFRLNQRVKGSKSSAHCVGYAADIVPKDGNLQDIRTFKIFMRKWLKQNNIAYDQFIDERNLKGSEWVHIGLRSQAGRQRRQNLKTLDAKNYTLLPPI